MENFQKKWDCLQYHILYKDTRQRDVFSQRRVCVLQHERDISGGQSLSGNMVSSDCWGMSTLLILCKPVWGMIVLQLSILFLCENSPSSQSIYGSWKGHVEQGDSVVLHLRLDPWALRRLDLNEVM